MNHTCIYRIFEQRAAPKASSPSPTSSNGSPTAHHDVDFDPTDLMLVALYTTVTALVSNLVGPESSDRRRVATSRRRVAIGKVAIVRLVTARPVTVRPVTVRPETVRPETVRAPSAHRYEAGIATSQHSFTSIYQYTRMSWSKDAPDSCNETSFPVDYDDRVEN